MLERPGWPSAEDVPFALARSRLLVEELEGVLEEPLGVLEVGPVSGVGFWSRFNRRGLPWSAYGGLPPCTVLTAFSPIVSGTAFTSWPQASSDWYPLQTPGLISVPAAFAMGRLGSITSSREPQVDFRHVQHGILTGQGAR